MDCKICNPGTQDDNICDYHARLLQPMMEWMSDVTGDSSWNDIEALKQDITGTDIDKVSGFLAGAQMPVAVILADGFGTRRGWLAATSNPQFEFVAERDWP